MGDYSGKKIWIVGASSGIGHAAAIEFGRRGASLALSSRNSDKLEALNNTLTGKHLVAPCDVTDLASLSKAAQDVFGFFNHIDIIIFLAGSYEPMKLDALDIVQTRKIIDINLNGAFNLIHVSLPMLLKQKSGQMAICASVAGYRGLPNGQPYSATKAALINLTESLRAEMAPRGLDIRLISPGFVKTPMTDKNTFSMPMMIEVETAAKILADELQSCHFEILFPKIFVWIMKMLRIMPSSLYFRIIPK